MNGRSVVLWLEYSPPKIIWKTKGLCSKLGFSYLYRYTIFSKLCTPASFECTLADTEEINVPVQSAQRFKGVQIIS